MEIIKRTNPIITKSTSKTSVKKSVTKKAVAKKSTTKKSTNSLKVVKPNYKLVTPELVSQISEALGLKSFSRPFAGLIDQGDFGTVATYIPLYADEFDKLPEFLKENAYEIAKGRYGLICHLPRTFDSPDGGKVKSITEITDKHGNVIKAEYTTDLGNTLTATHELRLMKLLTYVKNQKIPTVIEKEK